MKFLSFIWLLPFICFFSSYFLCVYFIDQQVIVPPVIGKSLEDALLALSHHHLTAQVSTYSGTTTSHTGIVINQAPAAGHHARAQQAVHLIAALPKPPLRAPLLIGKSYDTIMEESRKKEFSLEVYRLLFSTTAQYVLCTISCSRNSPVRSCYNYCLYRRIVTLVSVNAFFYQPTSLAGLSSTPRNRITPEIIRLSGEPMLTEKPSYALSIKTAPPTGSAYRS